ncbi:MAG: transcriptional regulator, partial [Gemmobacter sp.]
LGQIDRLQTLADQLYPSLRIYPFDARRVFSAPVTVFGPLLAVVYLGRHYIAFRDTARVASISAHFDWLVREAALGARDFTSHLQELRVRVQNS